jgi:DNA modification methylase
MELFNGDCLEIMKDLSDNSIDIVISDLPFGRFKHLEWDKAIDLKLMWKELWRICKHTTPIFLFGDFKFAIELYNSQPKFFKYEIVWNKGVTTTPLLSRKRFGKCTEYILVFYKKQCVYNYSKYHKIIKKEKKLPLNIIEENSNSLMFGGVTEWVGAKKVPNNYNPKLPLNIIENDVVFTPMAMGSDNKMYHAKSGKYEPRLPLNIIEENGIVTNYDKNHKTKEKITMGDAWNGTIFKSFNNKYNPKLPLNVFKCNSKRNKKTIKKLTEKPQPILEHLLKYFSNEGDTCLDICMGSGSMGVACKTLNRKFIGIEMNKEFFEITKKRLTG